MKILLQRLLLVVLMLAVFTVTVVVTLYLLGAYPLPTSRALSLSVNGLND
jgi:hypothetical protein